MSKQVYTVKNSKGQVIGARQSARAYTHALIINDMRVESYSSSEQGARRAVSKFFQYRDEAFKAAHSTAVVPVECIGAVKPVTLTAEGCDLTVKTFHAYKYALLDTATGKVYSWGSNGACMFYTLEAAQAFHAEFRSDTARRVKIVSMIDPRDAVEPAPAPAVEPAPAPAVEPAVEIAALKAQVAELQAEVKKLEERAEALAEARRESTQYMIDKHERYMNKRDDLIEAQAAEIAALKAQLNPVDGFSAALEFIEDIKAQVEPAPAPAPAIELKPININPRWSSTTRVKDPSIKRAVWLAGCAHNTPLHQAAVSIWESEEQAYKKARCYRVDFVDGSAAYELRWQIMANQYPTGWYKQV